MSMMKILSVTSRFLWLHHYTLRFIFSFVQQQFMAIFFLNLRNSELPTFMKMYGPMALITYSQFCSFEEFTVLDDNVCDVANEVW